MWNQYYYLDLPKIRVSWACQQKMKLPSPYPLVFFEYFQNRYI